MLYNQRLEKEVPYHQLYPQLNATSFRSELPIISRPVTADHGVVLAQVLIDTWTGDNVWSQRKKHDIEAS